MTVNIALDISALDETFKSHAIRGIGRYVRELKKYFDSHSSPEIKVNYFDHNEFRNSGMISRAIDMMPYGRATLRQQLVYPLKLRGGANKAMHALHFPAHMDAPAWSVKDYILTVHDLIPMVLKDLYKSFQPGWRYNFARWLDIVSIKNARLLIASSANTAKDLREVLGIPEEKIFVVPLGIDQKFFAQPDRYDALELRARYNIPAERPIILYVGGIDPRKNTKALLETLMLILEEAEEKKMSRPCLVIAGKIISDREYPGLVAEIEKAGLKNDVILAGFVPDQDLLQIFEISSVFFFPSLYEGFGFPPLEAMAAGLPVVSSNTSCMPEMLADGAMLVTPTDYKQCAAGISAVLSNKELADSLKEKGKKRAAIYTWSKTGDLTFKAYEDFARRIK